MRGHETMTVHGVPEVRVLEPVHVDVEAVRVHVHVGDENARLAIFTTAP